ncbi:MAG: hypothetical protein HY236_02575 [Acidobacteria bacterium]|nr:hypothetical protein [Acidobacteriota bacterium]
MRYLKQLSCLLAVWGGAAYAQETLTPAQKLERTGEPLRARVVLARAAELNPRSVGALRAYAEFLDSYNDPARREAYQKLLDALGPEESAERAEVARRLALVDLVAGDREAALRGLQIYRDAGGRIEEEVERALGRPVAGGSPATSETIEIPGALRSFERMAALSGDLGLSELLPALARNLVTSGYQAARNTEGLEPTEYLKLLSRYISQARELAQMAGPDQVIRISTCESSETGQLIKILGYRLRNGCGDDAVLETVNASRAFLTTDSGFPLAELEEALHKNQPFQYEFRPAKVPVLFGPAYWVSGEKNKQAADFLDVLLADPALARLYLAFIEKLVSKDDGWLASYFDALARLDGRPLEYFTEPARMRRFYLAVRGRVTSPGPARPVFRSNAELMLLTSRLQIGTDGVPRIPGGLEPWKQLFVNHPQGKYDGKLTRAANSWKAPDDLVEALFALCRKPVENEPLKIFLAISEVDRNRKIPLRPATITRLINEHRVYGTQYALLSDAPSLSDETILAMLDTMAGLSKIKDHGQRSDTIGMFQALVSVWQIFCRQGQILESQADRPLKSLTDLFAAVKNDRELFDAGRSGVRTLLSATGSSEGVSRQDRMLELLAGNAAPADQETYRQAVSELASLFELQRLVSLKTLFDLADHLESVSRGEKLNVAMANRLAARISEIRLPRTTLTSVEKNSFSFGYWTEKHVEEQRKLNLRQAVEKAAGNPEKLKETRGLLAPILRDTLVGFSYIYYAPPGAQIIRTNPLFVRSHDFLGVLAAVRTWRETELFGTGWPSNGGGRLLGSLTGLAYALAEAEQNFLVPTQRQALIWGDLVPQIILSAKVPRWWQVSAVEQHWLALHLRLGEELLAGAALEPKARERILEILGRQMTPARRFRIATLLAAGQARAAIELSTPSELYLLARGHLDAAWRPEGLAQAVCRGPVEREIRRLAQAEPSRANPARISEAFGSPHPTLANSYRPELLNLPTFPTLMGYSSRVLAESWESNNLYWATLADELYLPPAQLNLLVPQWTQKVVERIFATHLEDWPAVLRSLRWIGDDYRQKARRQLLDEVKAAALN